jgi:hypothetical protein
MPKIGSARHRASLSYPHAHSRSAHDKPRSGVPPPIFWAVQHRRSTQAAFNTHTSTALAAYCKSPYPHCSAHAIARSRNLSLRSTVDTALEIMRQLRNENAITANVTVVACCKAHFSATPNRRSTYARPTARPHKLRRRSAWSQEPTS